MFMFVLPLAVIGTAYGLIFSTISRKSKENSVMDSFQMPTKKSWVTRWFNYKHYLCMSVCTKPLSRKEGQWRNDKLNIPGTKGSNHYIFRVDLGGHYYAENNELTAPPSMLLASITSSSSTDPSRGPVRSHLLRKAKRKSLRMSFFIVMAFIVCWAPYYIFFIYVTFLEKVIDPMVFNCFSFIGLSNSMLNPMIYGAFQLCKFLEKKRLARNVAKAPELQPRPKSPLRVSARHTC